MHLISRFRSAETAAVAREEPPGDLRLDDDSRVAVIGGGPAGAFFSYFLLDIAARAGRRVFVDIYESRDFLTTGPAGCNMCGGIVSEFLVQALAAEGIRLPPTVVERGIDSYVLHTEAGSVRIATPLNEKRIAAVHRGAGPRGMTQSKWQSFDGFLLGLAQEKGARLVRGRVDSIQWEDGRPCVGTHDSPSRAYDLLVAAVGVNSSTLNLLQAAVPGYRQPGTSKTFICEFYLGHDMITRCLGTSMHVFLLRLPRVEFAALIPKGDYVSVCLLGHDIDRPLVEAFLDSPEVKGCFPSDWRRLPQANCHCAPKLSISSARQFFADRFVCVGDCGITRLYKDGIGAAYRTAKAAAVTAVFEGVSADAFERHFAPTCRAIARDNALGRLIFTMARWHQKRALDQRGILRMVAREQRRPAAAPRMSGVLWDVFTGSATYANIFLRTLHPLFWGRLLWEIAAGLLRPGVEFQAMPVAAAAQGGAESLGLGRTYHDGEVIIRQGDAGECMYVLQSGRVEVVLTNEDGREVLLAKLSDPDIFGEMALCDREVRSATVRAVGEVRALTVDREMFLRRVHQDPSLALRVIQRLAMRVRRADEALGKENPGRAQLHNVTR